MDDQDKRIDIEDLPRATEEVSDEEAKNVQGGLSKTGAGTLTLASANTYTGTTSVQQSDTTEKLGDGSV